MRLHTLRIEAFGPFADVETIDFDSVGADGLFLLHGQTGAGKTTILDAIAFALYGAVPGARTESKRFLSDHAREGAIPRVTLEASVKGRRFRIIRSPEYDRPKKRGDGSVKEKAKAVLTWLEPDGTPGRGENLTRIEEIADTVRDLLGMSKDQFFQVVLLPQGEFAKFLRASNEEREKLLESLFETKRFGSVEAWFADRRKEAEARLDLARQRVDVVLGKITHAAGIDDGPDGNPREWIEQLRDFLRQRVTTAAARLDQTATAFDQAQHRLDGVRVQAERQLRFRDAESALSKLTAGETLRRDLATELDRARRAKPFETADRDLVRFQQAADDAVLEMKLAVDELTVLNGGAAVAEALSWPAKAHDDTNLQKAITSWTEESGGLTRLCERADEADRLERDISRIDDEVAAIDDERTRLVTELDRIPAKKGQLDQDIDEAVAAEARIEGLRTGIRQLKKVRSAAHELPSVREALIDAQDALIRARSNHLESRERLVALRELRIAGMAGELANRLEAGEPCAVCGSETHPKPAPFSPTAVTPEDEQSAVDSEQLAADAFEAARVAVAELEKRAELLGGESGGRSLRDIDAELTEATASLAEAERCGGQLGGLRSAREKLLGRARALEERISELSSKRAGLEERFDGLTAQLAELRATLDAARGEDTDVVARKARLDALARAASHLHGTRGKAEAAVLRTEEHHAYLQSLAREAGFQSLTDARNGVRTVRWIADTEAALEDARDRKVRAQAVLDDPLVSDAAEQPTANVEAAESAVTEARAALEAAVREHAQAQRANDGVISLAGDFESALEDLGPAEERYAQLSLLSEVIAGRGQNTRRMSLRSYVLAARLEEVAVAASARLRIMSGGRYEFIHSDAAGPRGLRGGLGLDIRDDYTGVVRSAKTLSGGETFMASLSLALGLADVVTSEAGGIMLDTLFIDEGFGTLDSDTLDAVMGVLDELRAGGRVVGIVSHVDEMRQRIPCRLHVVKTRTGSHVRSSVTALSEAPVG
ncbi:AAA family ATPase [Hoyosella altamirensis]|uniref:Nuclease SbcCD subunit C n=1 Tax=Hoyosella altamirensis TaxID=616997 RepID=A0A839RJ64_9ACTN|nr:SMC family ATPase [Hoyosella altamirensis]MBB3036051.1 exonuclease SbcC [Hoyosella altamirensis]